MTPQRRPWTSRLWLVRKPPVAVVPSSYAAVGPTATREVAGSSVVHAIVAEIVPGEAEAPLTIGAAVSGWTSRK